MNKKRIIYIAIIVVIIFGGAIITVTVNQYKKRITFTQEKWIAEPNKRFLIAEDMVKRYSFGNMTKEEIVNLLGEPDDKSKKPSALCLKTHGGYHQIDLDNPNIICYYTKTGQMPEDFYGFYIMFDNNEKVSDYAIIHFTT